MEVRGQFHASAALPPEKNPAAATDFLIEKKKFCRNATDV
jgi:hypothetical protein